MSVLHALGHVVDYTGPINQCFRSTIAVAWWPFYGKMGGARLNSFNVHSKTKRMLRLLLPVITYRMARRLWTMGKANTLD